MTKPLALLLPWALVTLSCLSAVADTTPQAGITRASIARGVIPFTSAEVRSADDHAFMITWAAPGTTAVAIYAGTSARDVGRSRLIAKGGPAGAVRVSGLREADRWYF